MLILFDPSGRHVETAPAEAGEWYPDDTVLAQEAPDGRRLAHGPIRVSRYQADDWPERAGRVWDEQTGAWLLSGAEPKERPRDRARRQLRSRQIGDRVTPEETAEILREMREVLL